MRNTLLMLTLLLCSCASTNNDSDSDKIVNEFKEAGQKVGDGIKKGASNIEESICDTFSSDPDSCKE